MVAVDTGPGVAADSDQAAATNKDRVMVIGSVAAYSDVTAAE